MPDYIIALLSSSVISSLITLAGGYFIVNKKDAEFKTMLEQQKKISEIYYEERAKLLQDLYRYLINRNNDITNLMKFLGETSNGGTYSNSVKFIQRYEKFEENEEKVAQLLTYSYIFFKKEDYLAIKNFYDFWSKPVPFIVDLFKLYDKIPDKEILKSSEFMFFSKKVKEVKLAELFNERVRNDGKKDDFENIVKIIRDTIATNEIVE